MKQFINKALFATLLSGALLTGCKEDEFVGEVAPRLFSPVKLEQVADIIEIQLTWQSVTDAVGYTLEVAADSSFTEILASYQTTETKIELNELDFETKYIPRVKANAASTEMDSKFTIGKPFTTPNAPVVIKSPKEVGRDYAILVWDNTQTVNSLRLSKLSAQDEYVDFDITGEDQAAGEKRIEGLDAATTYQAVIMNNGQRFNKISFRTKDALPAGSIEVPMGADLKEYLDMANAFEGAAVVVLPAGSEYELTDSYQISNDITIICENGQKPLLRLKQLNIVGSVGTVRFENIEATGILTDGNRGDYFIKMIASGDDKFDYMEELILRDVHIHDFTRSVVRHEAKGGGYGKLTVEKALIHNIGEVGQSYMIFHMGDDSKVNIYDIKESTFYNFVYGLIQQQKSSMQNFTELVNIENCTFNNFGADKYFANFKGHEGGAFNIKNCIFGKVTAPAKFRGIYGVSSSTTLGFALTVISTFNTSDYGTSSNAIKGLIGTALSSEEMFEDAANGNFKVTDPAYAASGDSRWN